MTSDLTTVLGGLARLIRPRQWVKNTFVLTPLVFSGQFNVPEQIEHALLAFVLFCVASSATYILNDILDIERDRAHPKKRYTRPLAAGEVTIPQALVAMGVLYAILLAGFLVQPLVTLVILGYLAVNVGYTIALKHEPVIDIFVISSGFVLRVYAGAVALSVPVSPWMFVTTLCLALYLASIKRRQELIQSGAEGRQVLGRYSVPLIDRFAEMAATGALVFYSLFVVTARPELVVSIPFVLYGIYRYWYVVEILESGESPTDALLADKQLIVTVLLWIGTCGWIILKGDLSL
ncbi:MAG: decaprenyl-phosphate phosphoribosyltransferase [Alphaproteobacteria bacterium]|nr:decaprenyl-phosphate phosphoribosyltransferase [Alphaproteobacteria bacterium]MDX5369763.1 decaprenyl-phosphate phosphoribosyltransferase [Alphaproteobacteria bacterium]MDX5464387.1 decaprenyl-phosphate phosphoribosyltransferase [Alphaproteobacteria bacterium]